MHGKYLTGDNNLLSPVFINLPSPVFQPAVAPKTRHPAQAFPATQAQPTSGLSHKHDDDYDHKDVEDADYDDIFMTFPAIQVQQTSRLSQKTNKTKNLKNKQVFPATQVQPISRLREAIIGKKLGFYGHFP